MKIKFELKQIENILLFRVLDIIRVEAHTYKKIYYYDKESKSCIFQFSTNMYLHNPNPLYDSTTFDSLNETKDKKKLIIDSIYDWSINCPEVKDIEDTFDFLQACRYMQEGKIVRCLDWNDTNPSYMYSKMNGFMWDTGRPGIHHLHIDNYLSQWKLVKEPITIDYSQDIFEF